MIKFFNLATADNNNHKIFGKFLSKLAQKIYFILTLPLFDPNYFEIFNWPAYLNSSQLAREHLRFLIYQHFNLQQCLGFAESLNSQNSFCHRSFSGHELLVVEQASSAECRVPVIIFTFYFFRLVTKSLKNHYRILRIMRFT